MGTDSTAQAAADPAASERTDVRALVDLIDTIYGTNTQWLGKKNKELTEPEPFCLLMFDHNGVENYMVIPDFQFMEYRSKEAADSAFTAVEELVATGTLANSFDEEEQQRVERAMRTFSKSGSTYLLAGNVILHHERGCDFSKEDVSRENALIDAVFERYANVRMMQGDCGWGMVGRRPAREDEKVLGEWKVIDDKDLGIGSLRVTRDSIIVVDAKGEQHAHVLRSITPDAADPDGHLIKYDDRMLCMYFSPKGVYLNRCCDNCSTPKIERVSH